MYAKRGRLLSAYSNTVAGVVYPLFLSEIDEGFVFPGFPGFVGEVPGFAEAELVGFSESGVMQLF